MQDGHVRTELVRRGAHPRHQLVALRVRQRVPQQLVMAGLVDRGEVEPPLCVGHHAACAGGPQEPCARSVHGALEQQSGASLRTQLFNEEIEQLLRDAAATVVGVHLDVDLGDIEVVVGLSIHPHPGDRRRAVVGDPAGLLGPREGPLRARLEREPAGWRVVGPVVSLRRQADLEGGAHRLLVGSGQLEDAKVRGHGESIS
jgi:hypothetical protein